MPGNRFSPVVPFWSRTSVRENKLVRSAKRTRLDGELAGVFACVPEAAGANAMTILYKPARLDEKPNPQQMNERTDS